LDSGGLSKPEMSGKDETIHSDQWSNLGEIPYLKSEDKMHADGGSTWDLQWWGLKGQSPKGMA